MRTVLPPQRLPTQDEYVLLVVGDHVQALALTDCFSSGGHSIAAVRTVLQALAALQLAAPALILFGLPLATAEERLAFQALAGACAVPAVLLGAAEPEEALGEVNRILLLSRRLGRTQRAA